MSPDADQLVYRSRPSKKSMGQQYNLYTDRIEIQSRVLFHTIVVPLHQIDCIETRTYGKGNSFLDNWWSFNNDWAGFQRHVYMRRNAGWPRRIRFTPDDPDAFVAACKAAMQRSRSSNGTT